MALPPEVLTTTMRAHQKYFALEDGAGKLARASSWSPISSRKDGGAAIIAGNERVLRARSGDAEFFWDQDRKARWRRGCRRCADRLPRQARHGRRESRARGATLAPRARPQSARRRCGSTPSARRGWPRPIWSPAWSASSPSCRASWAATTRLQRASRRGRRSHRRALCAARARTTSARPHRSASRWRSPTSSTRWSGFFAIGEKPTGSKDPFALRRAALGVIRLIFENGLRLGLRSTSTKRKHDARLTIEPFRRADRIPCRSPEGASARKGRAARPDRRRVRVGWRGRPGAPARASGGVAAVPRRRRRG